MHPRSQPAQLRARDRRRLPAAASAPAADTAVEHWVAQHRAAVATTSSPDDFYDRLATGRISPADGAALIALLDTVQHTA